MFEEYGSDDRFFTALQIHAICADAKIDIDKTRLLTYMYFKINDNGNDLTYFEQESEQDCGALEVMLGNMAPLRKLLSDYSVDNSTPCCIAVHCTDIANSIRKLDVALRFNVGMENRLSGELRNRLRLYRDEAFRIEMMHLYNEIVIPRIDLYEAPTIKRAFKQAHERSGRSEFAT